MKFVWLHGFLFGTCCWPSRGKDDWLVVVRAAVAGLDLDPPQLVQPLVLPLLPASSSSHEDLFLEVHEAS